MPAPNVVLMDISMAKFNGDATKREICKCAQLRALPIFAPTAREIKGDWEKRVNVGANDCIVKPVNTDQFLSRMRVWFFR